MSKGIYIDGENKVLPDGQDPDSRYEIRAGDFLVTRANTPDLVGDVAFVDETASRRLLPDLIYRVEFLPGLVNKSYLRYVLLSHQARAMVASTARGSSQSMVKLRGEDIRSWAVPLPDPETQTRVARRMQESHRFILELSHRMSQQMVRLAERRASLVQSRVAGATGHDR